MTMGPDWASLPPPSSSTGGGGTEAGVGQGLRGPGEPATQQPLCTDARVEEVTTDGIWQRYEGEWKADRGRRTASANGRGGQGPQAGYLWKDS